jgi:dihydrodipicolinate synthase/N-acetylneuraminate lyase
VPDRFHGVLPALITPFTEDGMRVDTDALAANVARLIRAGVGGLVPGGSTGEFTTLTHDERRQLAESTIAAADGHVPVVVGTGALSTAETVELSVHAERSGATAVMIVPPFYDALGWRELVAHYTAVAERIAIPIMYYNLPSASGVRLDADQFRKLHRAANVTCLKDAGVRAVVWGVASIMPEQCVTLHRLLIDDIDLPAARDLWARLWPLCRFLESRSYAAAVKTACALVGDTTGPVRAPLLPLDDESTAELQRLLEHARAASPARA